MKHPIDRKIHNFEYKLFSFYVLIALFLFKSFCYVNKLLLRQFLRPLVVLQLVTYPNKCQEKWISLEFFTAIILEKDVFTK